MTSITPSNDPYKYEFYSMLKNGDLDVDIGKMKINVRLGWRKSMH